MTQQQIGHSTREEEALTRRDTAGDTASAALGAALRLQQDQMAARLGLASSSIHNPVRGADLATAAPPVLRYVGPASRGQQAALQVRPTFAFSCEVKKGSPGAYSVSSVSEVALMKLVNTLTEVIYNLQDDDNTLKCSASVKIENSGAKAAVVVTVSKVLSTSLFTSLVSLKLFGQPEKASCAVISNLDVQTACALCVNPGVPDWRSSFFSEVHLALMLQACRKAYDLLVILESAMQMRVMQARTDEGFDAERFIEYHQNRIDLTGEEEEEEEEDESAEPFDAERFIEYHHPIQLTGNVQEEDQQ